MPESLTLSRVRHIVRSAGGVRRLEGAPHEHHNRAWSRCSIRHGSCDSSRPPLLACAGGSTQNTNCEQLRVGFALAWRWEEIALRRSEEIVTGAQARNTWTMLRILQLALALGLASAFMAPATVSSKVTMSKVTMNGGKGFGGGEATRDPTPTVYDPNDPKGKQQAIHKAESFAEYLAKRNAAEGVAPAPAPAPVAVAPPPAPVYVAPPPAPAYVAPPPAPVAAPVAAPAAAPVAYVAPPPVAPPAAAPAPPAAPVAPAGAPPPPTLTAEQKAQIKAQEDAEDAALPPLADGSMVTFKEEWLGAIPARIRRHRLTHHVGSPCAARRVCSGQIGPDQPLRCAVQQVLCVHAGHAYGPGGSVY